MYMNVLFTRPSHICTQPSVIITIYMGSPTRPSHIHLPPLIIIDDSIMSIIIDTSQTFYGAWYALYIILQTASKTTILDIFHIIVIHMLCFICIDELLHESVLQGITFQYLYYILIILYRQLPKSFILFCCDTLSIMFFTIFSFVVFHVIIFKWDYLHLFIFILCFPKKNYELYQSHLPSSNSSAKYFFITDSNNLIIYTLI